ncbi:MAG: lipopolysaccharide biosynthesis protein [Planctomycetota bacterium]|jgi:O-antigen/teichoic acid export membrane protein
METRGFSKGRIYGYGTAAGFAGQSVEIACAFGQLWLLTQILPKAEFGRCAFALAAIQILTLLGSAGFERLTVFRLSRDDAPPGVLTGGPFAAAAVAWSVLLSTLIAGALWFAAPLIAALLNDDALGFWLRWLAWLLPVAAAGNTYTAWHQARQRIAQSIIVGRALPALVTVALLAGAWLGALGAAGVVAALIGGRLLVAFGWWCHRPINVLRGWSALDRNDARYAAHAAATSLLNRSLRHCDVLMLLPLAGPAVTAEYAIAVRLAWLLRSGHDLLSPIFTARIGFLLGRGRKSELLNEFDQSRAFAVLVALALSIPMIALGKQFLGMFGEYQSAYPVLVLLTAAQIALVTFGLSGMLLLMVGRAGWSVITNGLLLLTNVALNLILIPLFGGVGAAVATLTAVVAVKGLTGIVLWRAERLATFGHSQVGLITLGLAGLAPTAAGMVNPLAATAVVALLIALTASEQHEAIRAVGRWLFNRASSPPEIG